MRSVGWCHAIETTMALALPTVFLQWLEHHPLSISLLFLSFFFLYCLNRLFARKATNLPPSPPKLPFIGHLHHLGTLPHRSVHALSNKYGPLMLLHLGQTPTLVVSSAEMAKEITKTHDVTFANRPITTASKRIIYGDKDVAFAPYGEYWRQMKKVCVIDLLSVKRVQSFQFVREEEAANMVNKIKKQEGGEVNLSDSIATIVNTIVSRVTLGRSLEEEGGKGEYVELIKEVMDLFGFPSVEDTFPWLGWIDVLSGLDQRMKRASKTMHQFYDKVIEDHVKARQNGDGQADRKDFVDLLLDYEKDPASGIEFTRENFRSVITDMFVGGTDTTYTALEWAMAELMNHPNVMKKLQREVRGVVGTKSAVEETEINQMEYLNCVIKETLRLHPPLVFILPRVCTKTTSLQGYSISANTRVIINAWAINRDPKMWDKPDEFIPERFVNNPVDFRGQDFEFIPFGAGRRGCPAISFAMKTVESVLANLLYWFDWEVPGGEHNKEDIDMTEVFGLSVNLKSPLRLVPTVHTS